MLIVGVLCLCAAALCAVAAWRSLRSPRESGPRELAMRALVPTQCAAVVMLVAAGLVALAGGTSRLPVVLVCVLGAVGTVVAGIWQGGRYAVELAEASAPAGGCGSSCGGCSKICS